MDPIFPVTTIAKFLEKKSESQNWFVGVFFFIELNFFYLFFFIL
jgi:hypothetical protein